MRKVLLLTYTALCFAMIIVVSSICEILTGKSMIDELIKKYQYLENGQQRKTIQ